MKEKLHKYKKIESGFITDLKTLSAAERAVGCKKHGNSVSSRVFVETSAGCPPGSHVRFHLDLPGGGQYTLSGVIEWGNDGSLPGKPVGLGIHVLEMEEGREKGPADGDDPAAGREAPPVAEERRHGRSSLPPLEEIAELLHSLLDMKIAVEPGQPVQLDQEKPTAVATFVNEAGRVKTVLLCDLEGIIYLGAGMAVMPADLAHEFISSKNIPDNIAEIFQEVINESANLFNKSGKLHLSPGVLKITPDTLPDKVERLISKPGSRLDIKIEVPGYGTGMISLIESS